MTDQPEEVPALVAVQGDAAHVKLATKRDKDRKQAISVPLFNQGLTQVVQAAVAGLDPKKPCILALDDKPDGSGDLPGLAAFMTNPAGSAIVNAVGPIRQIVDAKHKDEKRYLVVATSADGNFTMRPRLTISYRTVSNG